MEKLGRGNQIDETPDGEDDNESRRGSDSDDSSSGSSSASDKNDGSDTIRDLEASAGDSAKGPSSMLRKTNIMSRNDAADGPEMGTAEHS